MVDESMKTLDKAMSEMEALLENPLGTNQDDSNPNKSVFDFDLFQTLTHAQNSHGIPLQDYAQYHAHCTKRLHRIRHHRDVRSSLVNNEKYGNKADDEAGPSSPSGKKGKSGGHAFYAQPKIPEDGAIEHEYMLWNLVFQAERAWAQACSLQHTSSISGTPNNKTKGRVLSRLNKAVHWARALEDAVTKHKCVSVATQREVHSYLMWMLGNQQLQRQEYTAAFRFYNSSRTILLELASDKQISAEATAEQLAMQDMWSNRADSLLLPLIRFCQYEARDDEDLAATGDDVLVTDGTASTPKKESGAITLEFRGQAIALDSYPQLAMLYLKLENRLKKESDDDATSKMSESDFLQFLADLDDTLRWTVQESQRYNNLPGGPAVQAKRRELASLEAFFQYHKLALQRKHQEDGLVSENIFEADAAEMLHVYEALLQNAQAMVDLNQKQLGSDDYNPEDDPYWLEAQAHVIRIRAIRCFQLARLYESPVWLAGATTAQAMALFKQCSRLQRRAVEEVAACDFAYAAEEEQYQTQLETLETYLQATMARVKATQYLESEEKSQETASSKTSVTSKASIRPLWLRLKDLDAGIVLADQDPSPITLPIPCKPVFYDVAWEQVTDTSDSLQVLDGFISSNEPKKSGGGGFFGWF